MAKKKATELFKLVSPFPTGYFKVVKRNPRKYPEKLTRRMYDPVERKHGVFTEKKLSS